VIARGDGDAKAAVANPPDESVSTPRMPGRCGKDGAFNAIRRATVRVARPEELRKDLASAKRYAER